MTANENLGNSPSGSDLVITRVFAAPRELVWRAWTDPEHFKRWGVPKTSRRRFAASICASAASTSGA